MVVVVAVAVAVLRLEIKDFLLQLSCYFLALIASPVTS